MLEQVAGRLEEWDEECAGLQSNIVGGRALSAADHARLRGGGWTRESRDNVKNIKLDT